MTHDMNASPLCRADLEILHAVLKRHGHPVGFPAVLEVRPDWQIAQAKAFLDRCLADGYLDWTRTGGYTVASLGEAFRLAGLHERIDRATAEKLLARAIQKARDWNADASRPIVIKALRLFGSVLEERDSYGDVDLEMHLAERPLPDTAWDEIIANVPDSHRSSFMFALRPRAVVYTWQGRKAQVALSWAGHAISITAEGTIEDLGAAWREVYAYDPATGTERDPDPRHFPRTAPLEQPAAAAAGISDDLRPWDVPALDPTGDNDPFWASDVAVAAQEGWWGVPQADGTRIPATPVSAQGAGEALWVDACSAWEVEGDTPFARLKAIHDRAADEGLIHPGSITLELTRTTAICEFWQAGDQERDDDPRVQILVTQKAGARDIELTPRLLQLSPPNANGWSEDVITHTGNPGMISLARTVAAPLFELLGATGIPSGAETWLRLRWDPETEPEPRMPKLGGLVRHVTRQATAMTIPGARLADFTARIPTDNGFWRVMTLTQDIELHVRGGVQAFAGEIEAGDTQIEVNTTAAAVLNRGCHREPLDGARTTEAVRLRARAELSNLASLGTDWTLKITRHAAIILCPDGESPDDLRDAAKAARVTIS